jgi:hypothetical protein
MQPYPSVQEQLDRPRKRRNRLVTVALTLLIIIGGVVDARAQEGMSAPEQCDLIGRIARLTITARQDGHPKEHARGTLLTSARGTAHYTVMSALIDKAYDVPVLEGEHKENVIHRFIGLHMYYCWEAVDR